MHYYLIINEGLSNGLVNSQVIKPIQQNSLGSQVGVISMEKPGTSRKTYPGIKCISIPIAVPYRLFLFNPIAHIMVPFLAFFYACVLASCTRSSDVLIARSYFPGIVLRYLKLIRGNHYKFDTRSLFVHESVTKGLLKEGSSLYRKWLNWEKLVLEGSDTVIAVAKKQEEYYHNVAAQPLDVRTIPCYASGPLRFAGQRQDLLPFTEEDVVIAYYGSLDNGWNNIDTYAEFFGYAIENGYKVCIVSQNFRELSLDPRLSHPYIFIVDTEKNKNYSAYLQVCDYGVVIMPEVPDWETRLSVKFAEYTNCGLGVLVGEYVGEAVRISQGHFPAINIVIRGSKCPGGLRRLQVQQRKEIIDKAHELFGFSNFKKILN